MIEPASLPKPPSRGPRLELTADEQIRIRTMEALLVYYQDKALMGATLEPKTLVIRAKVIESYIKGED